MNKPLRILAVNGESDPAETGSFIEMRKGGVDITVITWPGTFNHDRLIEAGVPTIAVGNITTWDQVNTILAAGRADLVALARPHLTNPHFTLQAAAFYGVKQQRWPIPYETGK